MPKTLVIMAAEFVLMPAELLSKFVKIASERERERELVLRLQNWC